MRNARARTTLVGLLLGILLALVCLPAFAGARAAQGHASRPAPRSSGSGQARAVKSSPSAPARTAPGTAVRTPPGTAVRTPPGTAHGQVPHRAIGRATYGYYGPYAPYYYPGGWWWPWGWGWGWDYYWWPSYSFGVWWGSGAYTTDPAPVYVVSDADVPAIVETDVHPRSASVRLDGEAVGYAKDYSGTWDELRVRAGAHTLEFSAPGYLTLRMDLSARPGGTYRIDEDLRKGEGLDPRSRPIGEAPPTQNALAPETARPSAEAESAPGGGASPALRRGLLKIVASPADAAVYLDGEFLATARELARLHGAIPVVEGPHHIEAVRPGFPARSVEVNVSATGTAKVELDLAVDPQSKSD